MVDRPQSRQVAHPTPLTYFKVAMILGALTAVEVGVFYIDFLKPAFLAIFLILSFAKFCLVVMFYMHLKFDHRLFSGVFVGPLLLAVAVGVVLMSLFQVLAATANPREGADVVVVPPKETEVAPTIPSPQIPAETPQVEIPPAVDIVAAGKEIYLNAPANAGPQALWCSQCHTIEGVSAGVIGPDQTHIGREAATRKPGMSAEEYIRESIRDPEKFICPPEVPRCTPGLMTNAITQGLTKDQVDAMVAFLLTLQ